jgi:hypothetical protein
LSLWSRSGAIVGLLAAGLMFAAAPAASPAAAQDTVGTVLIVRVPKDTAVVARIRAELEANDFWVREVGPDTASARAPLPVLAANAGARAALRMQTARSAIELWVASEGGASGGGEVVRLPNDDRDDALLAVRATEAMRARGLRLPRRSEGPAAVSSDGRMPASSVVGGTPSTTTTDPNPARSEAAEVERARKLAEAERQAEAQRQEAERLEAQRKTEAERQAQLEREAEERAEAEREAQERADAESEAEAQRQAEREAEEAERDQLARSDDRPSLIFIELGPAIAASPGGASPTFAGFANLRVQPSASWSASAFGFVPFAGGSFEQGANKADMRSFMLGGTLDLHAAVSGIEISAGAGSEVLITQMRGESAEALFKTAPVETQITGAIVARAGVHAAIASRVRVGARVMFGLGIPQLEMHVGSETITWGRPFVLGAITLDLGLPAPVR